MSTYRIYPTLDEFPVFIVADAIYLCLTIIAGVILQLYPSNLIGS